MYAGEVVILVVFLVNSCVLIGMGVPLARGLVPPNPLYGFRTSATLQDPGVWYSVNRLAGWWLATVAACTFLFRLGLPTAPLVNLAPLAVGVGGMILHGTHIARRLAERRP
jgi:hypothetical protein